MDKACVAVLLSTSNPFSVEFNVFKPKNHPILNVETSFCLFELVKKEGWAGECFSVLVPKILKFFH